MQLFAQSHILQKLSRQHNNTNILAFGARVIGIELAKMIIDEWLSAEFEGGRHQNQSRYDYSNLRINKQK